MSAVNRPQAQRPQTNRPQGRGVDFANLPAKPTHQTGMDFWSTPAAQPISFAPFLTADEKWELSQSGDVFTILAVRYKAVANYGPEWNVDLEWSGKFNAAGTNVFTLSLQAGKVTRDNILTAIMDYIEANPAAAVPARLVALATKTGGTFYAIENPNGETPARNDDDEIPF